MTGFKVIQMKTEWGAYRLPHYHSN